MHRSEFARQLLDNPSRKHTIKSVDVDIKPIDMSITYYRAALSIHVAASSRSKTKPRTFEGFIWLEERPITRALMADAEYDARENDQCGDVGMAFCHKTQLATTRECPPMLKVSC